MLTYVAFCITSYLVLSILRAQCKADATGYLLVSGLMPLPLYIVGHSAEAGIYAIDVCLVTFIVAHGLPFSGLAVKRQSLSVGVWALFGFSILAICSGAVNWIFVDQKALKFYAFTIVKFLEYSLLAMAVIGSKPDAAQLRKLCAIVLTGIAIYELLHVLHMSGLLPLSGEEYFGARAAEFDSGDMRAAPFSDKTGWFLTSYREVIGGTASISAWFSLMIFEAYSGKMKMISAGTAILAVFSVLATSSRSDIAGLAIAAIVFALSAPPRRWKTYATVVLALGSLYGAYLVFILPPEEQDTAVKRISEFWNPDLRAEGSYADRSHDRVALLSYLSEHPVELLIGAGPGNFHSYFDRGITRNFFGHNSYLHWTGELGIGGFLLLLAWCLSVCWFMKRRLSSHNSTCRLAARTGLAIITGRLVAAWGAESLFGTEGMGYYSLFFVGTVYLLISLAFDSATPNFTANPAKSRYGHWSLHPGEHDNSHRDLPRLAESGAQLAR